MDMAAQLSQLRRDIPGCHVAAFVDLDARMVLVLDARSKAPQERLDGLADRARRLLNVPGQQDLNHAVAISSANLEVFLRGAAGSEDGLALVCGLETDLEAALDEGFRLLQGVACDA